jgi:hypothetical protein
VDGSRGPGKVCYISYSLKPDAAQLKSAKDKKGEASKKGKFLLAFFLRAGATVRQTMFRNSITNQ